MPELAIDQADRAMIGFAIQELVARMWREGEKSTGARADRFFTEDGVFIIENLVHAEGRADLLKVTSYREEIGPRISRHIMSNYNFDFDEFVSNGRVGAIAVMLHFGGTGHAPLPLEPPLALYDVEIKARLQADASWLLERLHMHPMFLGKDHPALTMPRNFSHPTS